MSESYGEFETSQRDGWGEADTGRDWVGTDSGKNSFGTSGVRSPRIDTLGIDPMNVVSKAADLVRAADAAQYAREPIPAEQKGQIRVRLLNATPDPLGSIAALGKQYKGEVVRNLSEVTDEERRSYLDDFGKTVLNGPLEAAQFHWQIEGLTRSITHQLVRARATFIAQESLRFAVPQGNWYEEVPRPPSIAGVKRRDFSALLRDEEYAARPASTEELMLDEWDDAFIHAQQKYERLIELGMPAEEARDVLPHGMPTRLHWITDLRTLLAEAGKRTCTQAQFPWRIIFAGMANELRSYGARPSPSYAVPGGRSFDQWQFREIASRLRPVCFQTGQCGFMAEFDRSCKIRSRVDALGTAGLGIPSDLWGDAEYLQEHVDRLDDDNGSAQEADFGRSNVIHDYEWAADPSAARS
jgi:flavin-dependent thymidylate synthase